MLAVNGGSVFQLVALAWSALAATLAPLLVVRCLRWPVTVGQSLAMMAAGLIAVLVWRYLLAYHTILFDAFPGMAAGFTVYVVGRIFSGGEDHQTSVRNEA